MQDSIAMDYKRRVPDSIEGLVPFIERRKAAVRKHQDDLNRDIRPFNPSQINSLGLILAESKLGRLLKKAGADKDDRLLPKGVSRTRCNFLIRASQYDRFIEEVFDQVVMFDTAVAKAEFSKVGPNGDKILKRLMRKGLAIEHACSSKMVDFKYHMDRYAEDVREIAGPDFDKVWAIIQRPHYETVTWGHVFRTAQSKGQQNKEKAIA